MGRSLTAFVTCWDDDGEGALRWVRWVRWGDEGLGRDERGKSGHEMGILRVGCPVSRWPVLLDINLGASGNPRLAGDAFDKLHVTLKGSKLGLRSACEVRRLFTCKY